jgi:LPS export ABC transporter protein LptC
MNQYYQAFIAIALCSLVTACGNKIEEIDAIASGDLSVQIERGKNIKIVYSDSANIKAIIYAPVMERHVAYGDSKDVFPKGIQLDFIDDQGKPSSHLKADEAIRDENKAKIFAKGNVVFYNEKGEKLESPELVWDERERIVTTEKIVRITQMQKGDHTIGFGFKANEDFSRFEIKRKVQGKINVADLMKELQ